MNESCNCPTESAKQPETKTTAVIHRPRFHSQENETGVTLRIALPGVKKEDLKLTLLESNLKVRALRSSGGNPESYELNLRLGNRFDGSKATAALDSGVLTLAVPIREESKPRQIAVN